MGELIILSGEACTGKTTMGRALAAELGYDFMSAGNHAREFARTKYCMDVHAFQNLCAANSDIDRQLDADICKKIYQTIVKKVGIVVDFRMGAFFFPGATSVLLKASPEVVRQRLAGRTGEDFSSLSIRNQQSRRRLLALYGYDYTLESNYRLTIDTDNLNPEQILMMVTRFSCSVHDGLIGNTK